MLQFIDLGEPIATRIEKAAKAAGRSIEIDYTNLRAPFIIDGERMNAADAADEYLPGGWDGIFG